MTGPPAVIGIAAAPSVQRRQRGGPRTGPFQHQDVALRSGELVPCPTRDADPPWVEISKDYWARVCGCRTEHARTSDGRLDPSSEAARPSWRAHRHGPECKHAELAVVVKIERHPDGGWRSECLTCTTRCSYWWNPDHWERQRDGTMAKVTFRGPCRFLYELAADDV